MGAMHDQTFPESEESPERRTARALEALKYEQSAGLGFRRRSRQALGDAYGNPEEHQVHREMTRAEVVGGFMAALAIVLGAAAVLYKPLLLGFLALIFGTFGLIGDQPSRIARVGFIVAGIGWSVGMLLAIFVINNAVW